MMWTDPLKHIGLFRPHDGRVIDWSNVTTITIDDRHDKDVTTCLASITKWHRRFLRPAREVIISGARPDVDGIDWIRAEKFKGEKLDTYSLWCQKELLNHFDTPFVLVWQADGFALNPEYWSDDFFGYDYTGSPFKWSPDLVGNGGFCLRSRKFCEEVGKLPDTGSIPEDVYFCYNNRSKLESYGIRFCPRSLAKTWGSEFDQVHGALDRCFGFHGQGLWNEVYRLISGLAKNERMLKNGSYWDGNSLRFTHGKSLSVRQLPMNHVADLDLGRK